MQKFGTFYLPSWHRLDRYARIVKPKVSSDETEMQATFQDINLNPTPGSSSPPPVPMDEGKEENSSNGAASFSHEVQEEAIPVAALSFGDGTAVVTPGADMPSQAPTSSL